MTNNMITIKEYDYLTIKVKNAHKFARLEPIYLKHSVLYEDIFPHIVSIKDFENGKYEFINEKYVNSRNIQYCQNDDICIGEQIYDNNEMITFKMFDANNLTNMKMTIQDCVQIINNYEFKQSFNMTFKDITQIKYIHSTYKILMCDFTTYEPIDCVFETIV